MSARPSRRDCHFVDASALAKLVVREDGSQRVRELHDPQTRGILAATRLAPIEVSAALHRLVREGILDGAVARRLGRTILDMVEASYEVQEITAAVASDAVRLLGHHRLSPADAMHLAAAHELARGRRDLRVVVLSSDAVLNEAARAQGLETEDPTEPP